MVKEILAVNTPTGIEWKETAAVSTNKEYPAVDANRETLMAVKPGFDHLVDEILLGVEEAGLRAVLWGATTLRREEASQLYYQDRGKPWHDKVTTYLVSGSISVFLIRGEDAFTKVLELRARIREEYALGRTENVLHAPSSPDKLQRDFDFFRRLLGSEPDPEEQNL